MHFAKYSAKKVLWSKYIVIHVYILWSQIWLIKFHLQVGLSPASWKCSEEFFSNQIKSRDPLKLGSVYATIHPFDTSTPLYYFVWFLWVCWRMNIFFTRCLQVSKCISFAISAPSITLGPGKFFIAHG